MLKVLPLWPLLCNVRCVNAWHWRQQPECKLPTPEEALRSLLRGGSPYDGNETLASYQASLVSIPENVAGCPSLHQVLPHDDHRYLEEKTQLMLRAANDLDDIVPVKPYYDPELRFNQKAYQRLVVRLHDIG